ncbi:hypothetical protein COY62_00600 [bacterium (Candidatus Howlettbacteria) CG_4_10_14_0_8_um_filter_40_9]|nr:MAG: hypothetical protein COY62_00600 [bacterium (Candidatus Howlettbacteria) CG_4_10_14_0_8_um_filter_40_9]
MANIIEVKNLTKKYGNFKAVDNISFEVKKGEIFGILGPNGAGKTTTLEMLESLRTPTSGIVKVLGFDVSTNAHEIKERIGVQLQATAFFDFLSCEETLDLFGSFYDEAQKSSKLLEEVSLMPKAKTFVNDLSGGQKQRLSIAMALVNSPELIFLDEPTTGLDPQARRNLWDLIDAIRKGGKTIILTTHYMEEAEYLCDRVAIMDEAKIKDIDSPRGLIRKLKAENKVEFSADKKIDLKKLEKETGALTADYVEGDVYSLRTKDSHKTINQLLEYAKKNDIKLDNLHISQATLEDVFLSYTGKSLREK